VHELRSLVSSGALTTDFNSRCSVVYEVEN